MEPSVNRGRGLPLLVQFASLGRADRGARRRGDAVAAVAEGDRGADCRNAWERTRRRVEFVLVGGLAARARAAELFAKDLDIARKLSRNVACSTSVARRSPSLENSVLSRRASAKANARRRPLPSTRAKPKSPEFSGRPNWRLLNLPDGQGLVPSPALPGDVRERPGAQPQSGLLVFG